MNCIPGVIGAAVVAAAGWCAGLSEPPAQPPFQIDWAPADLMGPQPEYDATGATGKLSWGARVIAPGTTSEFDGTELVTRWKMRYELLDVPENDAFKERLAAVIAGELIKYAPVIPAKLKLSFYLVGSIQFDGHERTNRSAGDPRSASILIALGDVEPDRYEEEIGWAVHVELNRMLMALYWDEFPTDSWQRCNPEGFSYGSDAILAAAAVPDREIRAYYDQSALAEGFVRHSSKRDFHSDVLDVACCGMADTALYLHRCDPFPRALSKLEIYHAFLFRVSSRMLRE